MNLILILGIVVSIPTPFSGHREGLIAAVNSRAALELKSTPMIAMIISPRGPHGLSRSEIVYLLGINYPCDTESVHIGWGNFLTAIDPPVVGRLGCELMIVGLLTGALRLKLLLIKWVLVERGV